jgi:aspartate/glutamate racemase
MAATSEAEGNRPIAGFAIGILALDTRHHLVIGNVQHALSFSFPVVYEIVKDVRGSALMRGDPEAAAPIIRAAKALEAAGVMAIVGACGSFANYQLDVAKVVHVPVFLSILLEVPLILRALPASQQLGIIFATTTSFTDRVRRQCGIEATDRIVAIGADALPAFQPILAQEGALDDAALRSGLVGLACETMRAHPNIGAWLLQCSDLPPYAAAIRQATRRPVFDMVALIDHVREALCRNSIAQ